MLTFSLVFIFYIGLLYHLCTRFRFHLKSLFLGLAIFLFIIYGIIYMTISHQAIALTSITVVVAGLLFLLVSYIVVSYLCQLGHLKRLLNWLPLLLCLILFGYLWCIVFTGMFLGFV